MRKLFFILFYFCLLQQVFAQTDKRAKTSTIPPQIVDFIDKTYPKHSKIKFYEEIENDTLYYEAVFWQQKIAYNLLFEKEGNLYETEINLPFQNLPAEIKQKIEGYLQSNFLKYKIRETQEVDLQGKLLYELAIRAKKKAEKGYYEVYFDRKGVFLKIETIKLQTIQSLY